MQEINSLLLRLKEISDNGIFRRKTEIRTIETILLVKAEEYRQTVGYLERRIEDLERDPDSEGQDKGKKVPKKWEDTDPAREVPDHLLDALENDRCSQCKKNKIYKDGFCTKCYDELPF